jgi:hypothetical protein
MPKQHTAEAERPDLHLIEYITFCEYLLNHQMPLLTLRSTYLERHPQAPAAANSCCACMLQIAFAPPYIFAYTPLFA